ncbi:MAG: hypothetical protein ABJC79_02355 [Acidimicrobiia bacterium]
MADSTSAGATSAGATHAGRVGILVVYYLRSDDDLPILALHLDHVARHTRRPFMVYGVANRVTPAARELLEQHDWLRLCEVEPTDRRGSREHGYYLDALAAIAIADGVDSIVTLDVDSFPIADGWIETVADAASAHGGVAGVLRVENGDTALPHPSCVMMSATFFTRYRPSFSPDSDGTSEFRRFLRSTRQAGDTGLGLAYALWSQQLPWARLRRTNVVEVHPVIAGVYADCVFHLAGVASGTIFRRDLRASWVHRVTEPIERVPVRGGLRTVKLALLTRVQARSRRKIVERNRAVYSRVWDRLVHDPDRFFAELRGHPGAAPGSATARQWAP